MVRAIIRMNLWKKVTVFFVLAAITIAGYGLASNHPFHFGPEWSATPNSVAALHPSGERPDNIVTIPASDMSTSVTIRWRTSDAVDDGVVRFAVSDGETASHFQEADASFTKLVSAELTSDRTVHCHSATLANLLPDTTYSYFVGSKSRGVGKEGGTFSTAPQAPEAFSFVYVGDTQKKPERVGKMLAAIEKSHPETAFYMIGGDLVDTGDARNLWDDFLADSRGVFERKPVAAAMGNHDFGDHGLGTEIYNAYLSPSGGDPKRAGTVSNYSFRYGDAYFIVINSLDVSGQTQWLEKELRAADAAGGSFKIVMFHCPVYNPKKGRNNTRAQREWVPLFDRYRVDLVLSGHDHSYMRSKPLKAGRAVKDGKFGTVYVVATGCEKFYPFEPLDIAERQYADVATYQMITVEKEAGGKPKLRYTAYDSDGEIVDRFEKASLK